MDYRISSLLFGKKRIRYREMIAFLTILKEDKKWEIICHFSTCSIKYGWRAKYKLPEILSLRWKGRNASNIAKPLNERLIIFSILEINICSDI